MTKREIEKLIILLDALAKDAVITKRERETIHDVKQIAERQLT